MTLRVGVDARLIHWPGIGRYIHMLLSGLARRPDLQVTALVADEADAAIPASIDRVQVSAAPFTVSEQLELWRVAAALDISVFHSPHFNVPLLGRFPVVATVHDAAPLRYPPPGLAGLPRRAYASLFYWAVARRASLVLTVSEFAKAEIASLTSIRPNSILAVHNALATEFLASAAEAGAPPQGSARLVGEHPYVLYVGTNKSWKNLEVAVRAADTAAKRVRGLRLIIAGKQAANQEPLAALLARTSPACEVEITGTVSDAQLSTLYREALAVLCPSVYEGFGLTGLEAMACGTPVVHSGAASLPEVLGDAALTADPASPSAWASAICRIAEDPALRESLSAAGRARAQRFSLDQMIDKTVQAYRRVSEPAA